MVLTAFLLGLTGSFTHCVGMCSGMSVMLGQQRKRRSRHGILLLHLGRIMTYAVLGSLAGGLGLVLHAGADHHQGTVLPGLRQWQGGIALVTAAAAGYMALAVLGQVPSPEHLFVGFTRQWGRRMRSSKHQNVNLFSLGMLWGMLPCGLVLAALLTAIAAARPLTGTLAMFAFGMGTWPAMVGLGLAGQRFAWKRQLRPFTALLLFLFAGQMSLRALAAWGIVDHLVVGRLMLW